MVRLVNSTSHRFYPQAGAEGGLQQVLISRHEDVGFRIPSAVASALLDGEQPARVWREQRGLTQDALAGKARNSKAYLCQIETRKRVGALKPLRAIADALAVKFNELQGN